MEWRASRCFCALALCLSIILITIPMQAQIPLPTKSDCCALMKAHHDPSSHEGCPTDPVEQKQCCTACAMALTLFLATNSLFVFPPALGQRFGDCAARSSLRPDRPPVPPPRSFTA
jgi:hypothetical protein